MAILIRTGNSIPRSINAFEKSDGAFPDEQRLRRVESELVAHAMRRDMGAPFGTPELRRLAVLQHHGTATRLLDVSTDPMIALCFACTDQAHSAKQGVLFAIEVSSAMQLMWDDERSVADIVDALGDELNEELIVPKNR